MENDLVFEVNTKMVNEEIFACLNPFHYFHDYQITGLMIDHPHKRILLELLGHSWEKERENVWEILHLECEGCQFYQFNYMEAGAPKFNDIQHVDIANWGTFLFVTIQPKHFGPISYLYCIRITCQRKEEGVQIDSRWH